MAWPYCVSGQTFAAEPYLRFERFLLHTRKARREFIDLLRIFPVSDSSVSTATFPNFINPF